MIGRTFGGRYTMVARVGVGSMATVYRARQEATSRDVAVKVLRRDPKDPASKARFLREARASSMLASPNAVRVFDFGENDGGELYLVMELLEGESLAGRLTRLGRIPVSDAMGIATQALDALDEAHTKGIVHRDLKPANLFLARIADRQEDVLKVLDFGGAKFISDDGKELNAVDTQEGYAVGTPRYMSPEQALGNPLDGRSDLYSLGAVLYHLLTGRAPFTDDDPEQILAQHVKTTPERPSVVCKEAEIPPALDALVMRLLAKRPADRPATAKAAAELLREMAHVVSTPKLAAEDSASAPAHARSHTSEPPTLERGATVRSPRFTPRRVALVAAAALLVLGVRAWTQDSGASASVSPASSAFSPGAPPVDTAPSAFSSTLAATAPPKLTSPGALDASRSGPKSVSIDALRRADPSPHPPPPAALPPRPRAPAPSSPPPRAPAASATTDPPRTPKPPTPAGPDYDYFE